LRGVNREGCTVTGRVSDGVRRDVVGTLSALGVKESFLGRNRVSKKPEFKSFDHEISVKQINN
jgi:hypothetical protein